MSKQEIKTQVNALLSPSNSDMGIKISFQNPFHFIIEKPCLTSHNSAKMQLVLQQVYRQST